MIAALQRFLAKCDSIQKTFLFLMTVGLVIHYGGLLLNAGEGWPITRDGYNLFQASIWIGIIYSILNKLLSKIGIKSKAVSLIIAIPLAVILFVMLVGWALSGIF